MTLTAHIAKNFTEVHFGGNWATSNLKDTLAGITVAQANTRVQDLNTIAALVYHSYYYVREVLAVLRGGPLLASDAVSFQHPEFATQAQWDAFLQQVWADATTFASLVAQLPDGLMWQPFTADKYGTWYRNLQGIVEHTHYHLGQIVIVKKLVQAM